MGRAPGTSTTQSRPGSSSENMTEKLTIEKLKAIVWEKYQAAQARGAISKANAYLEIATLVDQLSADSSYHQTSLLDSPTQAITTKQGTL